MNNCWPKGFLLAYAQQAIREGVSKLAVGLRSMKIDVEKDRERVCRL
jgi:hypothetical protein